MLAVEYLKGHVFESWLVHFYLFCFVLSYYVINKHVSVFFLLYLLFKIWL